MGRAKKERKRRWEKRRKDGRVVGRKGKMGKGVEITDNYKICFMMFAFM